MEELTGSRKLLSLILLESISNQTRNQKLIGLIVVYFLFLVISFKPTPNEREASNYLFKKG